MKVICAGFIKTGTKSLAQALKILGYKVYDYDDQLFEIQDLWEKFFDGTVTNEYIRERLQDVDVIIDGPVIAFWEEIHRAIPEAKVILTIRDEDSWWKSLKKLTANTPVILKYFTYVAMLTPTGAPFMRLGEQLGTFFFGVEKPFQRLMLQQSDNARLCKFKYRQHNSHVLRSIPEQELLVYHLGDGWGPLCNFLDTEEPDVPYPHKNKDGSHFSKEGGPQNPAFRRMMIECGVVLAIFVLLLAIIVYWIISWAF